MSKLGERAARSVGLPDAAPAATTAAPLRSQGFGGEACDMEKRCGDGGESAGRGRFGRASSRSTLGVRSTAELGWEGGMRQRGQNQVAALPIPRLVPNPPPIFLAKLETTGSLQGKQREPRDGGGVLDPAHDTYSSLVPEKLMINPMFGPS